MIYDREKSLHKYWHPAANVCFIFEKIIVIEIMPGMFINNRCIAYSRTVRQNHIQSTKVNNFYFFLSEWEFFNFSICFILFYLKTSLSHIYVLVLLSSFIVNQRIYIIHIDILRTQIRFCSFECLFEIIKIYFYTSSWCFWGKL